MIGSKSLGNVSGGWVQILPLVVELQWGGSATNDLLPHLVNRPGLARAVLQTPSSLINQLSQ